MASLKSRGNGAVQSEVRTSEVDLVLEEAVMVVTVFDVQEPVFRHLGRRRRPANSQQFNTSAAAGRVVCVDSVNLLGFCLTWDPFAIKMRTRLPTPAVFLPF